MPVARSCSSVSVKSWASKKSSKSVDDAFSFRSSASMKTDDVSKNSTKSNEEISEVEESSDVDRNKTSSSILNQVKLIDLASESHIAVSYGSAEEETTVIKNTPLKHWPRITKAIAVVCIFCASALVSYTVITVCELNRNQSSQEQFLANTDDEPTFYPTYYPTYMPTTSSYAPTLDEEIVTRKPTVDEEIITTGKDRKEKKEKKTATDQDPV